MSYTPFGTQQHASSLPDLHATLSLADEGGEELERWQMRVPNSNGSVDVQQRQRRVGREKKLLCSSVMVLSNPNNSNTKLVSQGFQGLVSNNMRLDQQVIDCLAVGRMGDGMNDGGGDG